MVSRRISHNSRKEDLRAAKNDIPGGLDYLSRVFDRNLLAELITEDTWIDRLRIVIERNDRHSFDFMDPYTNPLWHQLSVMDYCILIDNRLMVPCQLRPAVLKRFHCGHPGQEAMLNVTH